MKRILFFLALCCFIAGCSKVQGGEPETGDVDLGGLPYGLTSFPEKPDADEAVTFYYKAEPGSELYGAGDLYFYTGVWYDSSDWRCVQADWGVNTDKCRMEKISDNIWKLTMSPTIREWYGSGSMAVCYLGIVIRNAEGNRQTRPDFIVEVTDALYEFDSFEATPVVKQQMPSGMTLGINYLSDTSVGLALYDADINGESHDYCYVIGEFSGWERDNDYAMKRDDEKKCWWYVFEGLVPGKEYMFQYCLKK